MAGELVPKSKYTISDEERQRRSERAKALHKQGRLGGAEFGRKGGRPRKKRASEIVAEQAASHADEIVKALKDGLRAKQPTVRLQAAKQWLDIESKEREIQLKEERALEEVPTDELMELVAERFARLAESGAIGEVIDAEAVEVRPEELGPGDGVGDVEEGTAAVRPATGGSGASPFSRRTAD